MRLSDNGNGSFTNPVIFADYPDPDIIRVEDDFYMVSSSFTDAPGIPVCHSRDLVNWKIIGHAYDRLPETNPAYSMADGQVAYRGGSWAPSIRHRADGFYIAFNTPAEGFCVAHSVNAEGPYELTWFDGHELYDPGLFFDDDGRVYVVHGANDIYLTPLSSNVRSVSGEPRLLYTTQYGTPLEGSHVYQRRGFYYICNTCRGYNGMQLVYRSEQIEGPYESRLITADDFNYAGAGLHQGGFVELANGETWFFLFQDRDYVGRVPVLIPMRWVDGWPVVGEVDNFGKVSPTNRKPALPEAAFSSTLGGDDFDSMRLGLQWQWNHNADDARWSLAARPGWLRLTSGHATDLLHARNTLTQKIMGDGCVATVMLDVSGLQCGDRAGLCVLGFPHAYLAVEKVESDWRMVFVRDGAQSDVTPLWKTPIVYLRCEARADGTAHFFYSADDVSFHVLGTPLVMQFSVRSFLGNKFGLFCFNPSGEGDFGHVDFDWMRYDCDGVHANHYDGQKRTEFDRYDSEHGIDTHRKVEKQPGQFVVNVHNGDWLQYDSIDFGNGVTRFKMLASVSGQGGQLELRIGGVDGRVIGECITPGNGERNPWLSPWQKFGCDVETIAGRQSLTFVARGPSVAFLRLDHFQFTNPNN